MYCIACNKRMGSLHGEYDGLYLCVCSAAGVIIMTSEILRSGSKAAVYLSGTDQQTLIDQLIGAANRN